MREKELVLWSAARLASRPPGSHFQGCGGGDLVAFREKRVTTFPERSRLSDFKPFNKRTSFEKQAIKPTPN